jgi:homogentisate 1,2-dioxygenase
MTHHHISYLSGFGNEFASEAIAGALPQGRNSPQRAPHGLYAELLSGTAFTAPRADNRRTWMYRRQPSVVAGAYKAYAQPLWTTGAAGGVATPPEPLRWHPFAVPDQPLDFVDGLRTLAANGDADMQTGMAALVYLANQSMMRRALVNSDGEMLLVPQQGRLVLTTELGVLEVRPGEIALVPRGMAFSVGLPDGPSRGYVCEVPTFACRSWAPSAPMASPMRGIFWRQWPLLRQMATARRQARALNWSRNTVASFGRARSRAALSMWWPGTAIWCPASTTPRTSW